MLIDRSVIKIELKIFSCILLIEQIIGEKLYFIIKPFKEMFLSYVHHILKDELLTSSAKVIEVDNINPEEFRSQLIKKSVPLVFRDKAISWDCCKKWNLDYFSFACGESDVLLVEAEGLTSRVKQEKFEILTIKDLITNIKNGGDKYLRFSPLLENNKFLSRDLDLNWLQSMQGNNKIGSTYYMFLGGKGQKTLLHSDQPCNLYIQVLGRKKWIFYSPDDSIFLYPNVSGTAYVKSNLDLDNVNLTNNPLFKFATKTEIVLNPGDVLYVPPHYWHQVENLDDCISVGYRFSSIEHAINSSMVFSLMRILSMNPPIWKTMSYGKVDTNLIWAHTAGIISEVTTALNNRKRNLK